MDITAQARKVIERSEELESQLQRPEILSDRARMTELSRLHKGLAETVAKSREYLSLLAETAEWEKAAADSSDPEMQKLAREELDRLAPEAPAREQELRVLFIPKDPNDQRGAILEIRAGTGGDEASIFAGDLFRMYKYFIEARGWRLTLVSDSEGTAGGFKEVLCEVDGAGAYGVLKYESGVHRVQRVPETEAQGRVHTSAATVVVMPQADDMDAIEVREEDIRVDTYRAGGAGGQHINKTDSAVRITHLPTGLVVACQDERSQHKNRAKAMNLLKSKLLDKQISEREAKEAAQRKSQVGTGDRSAKIRTYNFPQGRVTDHRVNLTLYKLDAVMKGDIRELIDALVMEANAEKLRDLEKQMNAPMAAEPATLLAVLNKASDYFKAKGVPDHRLDAQLLLGRVLGMRRLDLYMNFDRPLNDTELARYRELVKRRGRREPLQHLLGETPFRDLTLKSDARALIPRPETELLVDLARQAAAGRAGAALDVGVGAGPIYLSLLKELPGWRVCGVDLSQDCLDLTRENAERNGLHAEHLHHGDAFAPFADRRWDLVVSNPPYVGQGEMAGLEPEVRDFDPALALVGGPEGWEFAARLMAEAFPRLNPGGSLILEIGAGQSSILKEKSGIFAWQSFRTALDYQGVERFLILHK